MVKTILFWVVETYILVLLVYIVLSWFPSGARDRVGKARSALGLVTEPVLGPLRRLLPPMRFGGMGLDLSPIIVFFVLQFVIIPVIRVS